MLVETTSTLHTYTYHRLTLDESGVADAQSAIDDFQARYRVASSAPSSSLDDGDLYFDTTANKMKVYNASSSSWDDVAAPGNFFINTISSSSGAGGGSATFNGSATRFTLSNAPSQGAQQCIVSINGVVQKPNSGSSVPSEGFAIDGNDILFSSAPATGSDYFIVTCGNAVNIGTPSNNTVGTAVIQNLAVTTAKIANDAITGDKIATNLDLPDNNTIRFGTGNDLQIYHSGSHSFIKDSGTGNLQMWTTQLSLLDSGGTESIIQATENGSVELYHNNSKKFETTNTGISVTGKIEVSDDLDLTGASYNARWDKSANALELDNNAKIVLGTGGEVELYHNGSNTYFKAVSTDAGLMSIEGRGNVELFAWDKVLLRVNAGESGVTVNNNGSVDLYYDNSKKLETKSWGVQFNGDLENNSDSTRIKLGASDDLQIYHDGTHNYIEGATSGKYTTIRNVNGNLIFQAKSGENSIWCGPDSDVELMYDGSKKLETQAGGVEITGKLTFAGDGHTNGIELGAGADTLLYHDNSDAYFDNNVGDFYIRNDGSSTSEKVRIQAKGGEQSIVCSPNAGVELYYDNTLTCYTSNGCLSFPDSQKIFMGGGNDLQLYHDGSHSFIKDSGTGNLQMWTNQLSLLNAAGDESMIQALENGEVQLYHNNELKIKTTSTGAIIAGTSSANVLSIRNTTLGNGVVGILFSTQNHSGGREKAALFHQETHGTAHYGGDLVVCLNGAQGGATQVSISDRRATFKKDGGICFNSDTAYANALDDYEEGTWTPSYTNFSNVGDSNNRAKWYTKVGNVVTLWWDCFQTSNNMSISGDEYIQGVPFVPKSTGYYPISCVGYYSNGTMFNIVGYIDHDSNPFIRIKTSASNFRHMWGSVTYNV